MCSTQAVEVSTTAHVRYALACRLLQLRAPNAEYFDKLKHIGHQHFCYFPGDFQLIT